MGTAMVSVPPDRGPAAAEASDDVPAGKANAATAVMQAAKT